MDLFIQFISGIGILSIVIFILVICLIWLFIRSAVASGTKQGIIEAHNEINKLPNTKQVKTSMFDSDEKSYISILLLLFVIGLIVVYMFL